MSQSQRQSELFAGNDWLAAYQAFTQVNLNAFDFASIRSAMVDYIRSNYPEDFNDWIESSEFVALIDLLAFLGQSLAFRMDINARENFLDLARRRESILRLARSLSYPARRNYPARGLAKLTEIKTTMDVYDSTGKNLNNITIKWDDTTNPDWFEQWILVLNASLIQTNPFGVPLKTESLDSVETQLYRLNNTPSTAGNFPFSTNVNGQSYSFDVCNADFSSTYGIVEQSPDPDGHFHLMYRSDGNGNSSVDTGFFVYFKQGTLQKTDYSISNPQENRTITIATNNINETDVWVQTVDDLGSIVNNGDWTRVGFVPTDDLVKIVLTTENVTYNNIDPDIQNIFECVTQDGDQVMLRFGDGRFGASPTGNLRVWYRVSDGGNVTVRPEDMQGVGISIPFTSTNNQNKQVTLTFSLQETVNNSVQSESNTDVRRRASKIYGTQGRMVSGEDYNTLPQQTNLAVKLKAVNRIYSGQSRFIDLNDPTGSYQNTKVFAADGAFYRMVQNETMNVTHTTADAEEILNNFIPEVASSVALRDFYTNYLYTQLTGNQINISNNFTNDIFNTALVTREVTDNLNLNRTFALAFDNIQGWYVLNSTQVNSDLTAAYSGVFNDPNTWLIYVSYSSTSWTITNRGLSYVFESEQDAKFYFTQDYKSIDPQTGKAGSDTINVLKLPNALNKVGLDNGSGVVYPLQSDLVFKLEDNFTYADGFLEPRRVKVRFNDRLDNGTPDVPYSYQALKNIDPTRNTIVHQLTYDTDGYPVEVLLPRLELGVTPLATGDYGYYETSYGNVDIYIGDGTNLIPTAANKKGSLGISDNYQTINNQQFVVSEGINGLIFQWNHFAPTNHRLDPAITNVIDMFILTSDYNDDMLSWRNAGSIVGDMPVAPTELTLRTTFSQLEDYKMFSDEIIWRPVKFKLLFGTTADPTLQARFKVVPLMGTSVSDGEIKSKVIDAIRTYFDVSNWDFGETFYYSELGAFIHRQLATAISSVEIVPVLGDSYFGNLREIRCNPDELFFATAQVSDIDIISANTPTNLRIR